MVYDRTAQSIHLVFKNGTWPGHTTAYTVVSGKSDTEERVVGFVCGQLQYQRHLYGIAGRRRFGRSSKANQAWCDTVHLPQIQRRDRLRTVRRQRDQRCSTSPIDGRRSFVVVTIHAMYTVYDDQHFPSTSAHRPVDPFQAGEYMHLYCHRPAYHTAIAPTS